MKPNMLKTLKNSPIWRFAHRFKKNVVGNTRRVQKALPFLNITPKWLNSPEYATRYHAKWHKVFDQTQINHPPAIYYGALIANLERKLDTEIPELGLLELHNGLLLGKFGWIFSEEGYLIPDQSWYGTHLNEMKTVPRALPAGTHLEGVSLSLVTRFGRVYGHFVLDCLPRLELFNKAGLMLTDVDHIICRKPLPGNAWHLIEQLGIPASKFVWVDNKTAFRADILLAPSFPGTRMNYPQWVPEFLRRAFLPVQTSPPWRRLFISRSGYNRNPVNEDTINRILVKFGFEIYNPMDHEYSHIDFSEAAVIIGAHGSALAGIAFCQPGTKVLELIPTDHVHPFYYTLSDAAGLDYGCLVCRSTKDRGINVLKPSPYDFFVNEREFSDALTRITGELPPN